MSSGAPRSGTNAKGLASSRLPFVGTLLVIVACSDGTLLPELPQVDLELVSGAAQEAVVGTPVGALTVRAVGPDSLPVAGVPVRWEVLEGAGAVDPHEAMSDSLGLASVEWTLGPLLGTQRVAATTGASTVEFDAWATPPYPEDWTDFVELNRDVRVESGLLTAEVSLVNKWPGTVWVRWMGCWWTPLAFTESGDPVWVDVGGFNYCLFPSWPHFVRLPMGDTLPSMREKHTADLAPGSYVLLIRISETLEIAGQPARFPDYQEIFEVR